MLSDSDVTVSGISQRLLDEMHADHCDAIRCEAAISGEEIDAMRQAEQIKPQVRVAVQGKRFAVEVRKAGEVRWKRHGVFTSEAPAHLAANALLVKGGVA